MARRAWFALAFALTVAACAADGGADPEGGTAAEPPPSVPIGPGTTAPTTTAATTTAAPATTAPVTTEPLPPLLGLGLETVARGLDKPTFAIAPPGDDRLFVVEQDGVVRIVRDGEVEPEPFLDLTPVVGSRNLEQGLLGLAFHPDFADNGRLFAYYIDRSGDSRLVEVGVGDDPDRALGEEATLLLTVGQPASNHNGGMLQFGPDGYLYMALGDGGGANDQFGNGQRPDTLLGTLLRLDVDSAAPYAIPPDNPFVDGGGLPEVWAYGLRNPWRFAFDPAAGLLYVADVGQSRWEEINVVPVTDAGLNYGWPILEASECFQQAGCDATGTVLPAVEYSHTVGCSITGGFPYRGTAIPELVGHYFYSDWCGGFLRSFRYEDGVVGEEQDWTADVGVAGQVTTFGVDGSGELYLATSEGFLYRVIPVRG